jgi:hypothetical protein
MAISILERFRRPPIDHDALARHAGFTVARSTIVRTINGESIPLFHNVGKTPRGIDAENWLATLADRVDLELTGSLRPDLAVDRSLTHAASFKLISIEAGHHETVPRNVLRLVVHEKPVEAPPEA